MLEHFELLDSLFVGAIGGDTAFGRKPDPGGTPGPCATGRRRPRRDLLVGDSWVDVDTASASRGGRVTGALREATASDWAPPDGLRDGEMGVDSFDAARVAHRLKAASG